MSSQAVLSIDSALLNKTSKLPDIFLQNPPKIHQKGFKREFFSEKMTPGNSEAEFYVGVWRTLLLRLMNVVFFLKSSNHVGKWDKNASQSIRKYTKLNVETIILTLKIPAAKNAEQKCSQYQSKMYTASQYQLYFFTCMLRAQKSSDF